MMAQRVNLTDRAKRYRAQKNVTGPRKCVLCGSTRNLDVMHLDGNESHGEPANLAYGCRSCNGKLAAAFKRLGKGVPTNQYNPAQGVPTFDQYKWAVSHGFRHYWEKGTGWIPGEKDGPGAIIHATPKHLRTEYAKRILAGRNYVPARRTKEAEDRWNPPKLDAYGDPIPRGSVKVMGRVVKVGSKRHKELIAQKKHAEELQRSETGRMNPLLEVHRHYTRRGSGPFREVGQKLSDRRAADELNAEFLKGQAKPVRAGRYKGYTISKTEDGEYFSSLDPSSWFETKLKAQKHIDGYLKGRGRNLALVMGTLEREKLGRTLLKKKDALQNRWKAAHYAGQPTGDIERKIEYLDGQLKQVMKRNPATASAEVFEEFHGYAPNEVITVTKQIHHHAHLAAAGKLTHLDVWGVDGRGHEISKFQGAFLAFNEKKNQLFVEGGDQSVNLKDFGISRPHEMETLGQLTDIGYDTDKTHLGKEGGKAVYVHKFRSTNQNGKHVVVKIARYPDLIYDVRNESLLFSGGSYEILREGIDR